MIPIHIRIIYRWLIKGGALTVHEIVEKYGSELQILNPELPMDQALILLRTYDNK